MVERARLNPLSSPTLPVQSWKLRTGGVKLSAVSLGDRRFEASSYLTDGYGIAQILRSRGDCASLSDIARVWQPNRLKGVQVGPEFGTPFLAATQVFDVRPIARKWLAIERVQASNDRFVHPGTILVTCSGSVGRATISFDAHAAMLVSHDLLRVQPLQEESQGWIYAFLRAPKVRAMMRSAHYGHMIKHLEVSHLNALPVPPVDRAFRHRCSSIFASIQTARNQAHALIIESEKLYGEAAPVVQTEEQAASFTSSLMAIASSRRRLDASYNSPLVQSLKAQLELSKTTKLADDGFKAWLPNRFLRVPASDGVELVSSSALFEINPDAGDKIADRGFGDQASGRVKPGWLLIARSGQTYGLVGSVAMANRSLSNKVVSDHVIRLAPGTETTMRPGYVLAALSHPTLGRPLLKALPSGSSIPSIDFEDVLDLKIRRLDPDLEKDIADKVERANQLRGRADALEDGLGALADEKITGNR